MDVDFVLTAIVIAIAVWFFGVEPTIRFFWWIGMRIAHAITIMSSRPVREWVQLDVAAPLPAHDDEARQGFANVGNAVNDALPGNALPEEVRNIIRLQAKAEAVAALVNGGKIGKVEAIELVFDCRRSGRPESVYTQANAAVTPLVAAGPRFIQPDGSTSPATYPISGRRDP